MHQLRSLIVVLATFSAGCASASAATPKIPVRILSSEVSSVRLEAEPTSEQPAKPHDSLSPRIGAPGGSGAGSRRVAPAQSGNETVGGLPVGIGGSSGPEGRG
jgi:hypothetical protein